MLTLALTWTVPLTREPEPGDVMVTIRLPPGRGRGSGGSNCAGAWVAAEPRSPSRDAVLASLTWNSRVLLFMTSPLFFTLVLAIASRDDIQGIDDDPGVR